MPPGKYTSYICIFLTVYLEIKVLLLISTCIIIFTKFLDCSYSRIPENDLSLLNVTVKNVSDDSNLVIEYICDDGYDMLYEGDFVYECQGDGTWNNSNIPQCVNG